MLLKSSWWDMKLLVGWTSVAYKVTDWQNVPLPVLWCQHVLAIPCPVSPILSRLSLSLCVLPPWLSWLLIHADYDHLPPIRLINLKSLLRFFIHFMLDCCFSYCCSFRPSLWYSVSVLIVLCILVSFVFFLSLSCAPGLVLAYHSACSQTHEPPALTASGLSFILSAPAGPATPHPPPAVSLSHPPLCSFHLYFPCPSNKSSAFILSVFVCFWVHTAKHLTFVFLHLHLFALYLPLNVQYTYVTLAIWHL